MAFTKDTKLITAAEASEMLPVSAEYVRKLIQKGKLRGGQYGNRWMTTVEWVCEYVEESSYEARRKAASHA